MDIGRYMGNAHMKTPNEKVSQLVALDALVALVALPEFVDDDRVTCDSCQNCGTREADEFIDIDRARQLKSMGKRLGMAGDKFEQKGKWLRIHWTEAHCSATGFPPLLGQLKHRCHLYCKATEQPSSVKSDAWWQD
jgi:hypothetical protein